MRTRVRSLQYLLIISIGYGFVVCLNMGCAPKDTPPQTDSTQVKPCFISSKTVQSGSSKTTEYWNYGPDGKLQRHWSPGGWQDDYAYDNDGFLLSIKRTGENGQPASTLTCQYANERLITLTNLSASGTTLFTQTFAYDSTGLLKKSTLSVSGIGSTSLFLAGLQTDYSYSTSGNKYDHAYEFEKGRIRRSRLAGSKEFSDYEYDSTGLLRRISTYQLSGVSLAYVSYDYQAGKAALTSFVTPKGWPDAVKYNYNPDKGYYEFNSTNQSLGLVTNVSSYSGTMVNSVTKFSEQKISYSLSKQGLPLEQNWSVTNTNGTTTSRITYGYIGCQ
ncbi:hypothetical protein [Spirosoma aerolatum]|uniref:hypothetical protein n=1 Tax=Spirosoma aerolatum TaxID=1211326 RepID=UPI0012D2CBCD|nr:hypothetical protein [Spirosoma aerolatum]